MNVSRLLASPRARRRAHRPRRLLAPPPFSWQHRGGQRHSRGLAAGCYREALLMGPRAGCVIGIRGDAGARALRARPPRRARAGPRHVAEDRRSRPGWRSPQRASQVAHAVELRQRDIAIVRPGEQQHILADQVGDIASVKFARAASASAGWCYREGLSMGPRAGCVMDFMADAGRALA